MAKTNTDVREVTIQDANEALEIAFARKRPVFLWGPPGIGKSDLVKQLACKLNDMTEEEFQILDDAGEDVPLIDLRLPLYDITDLKGIPYYDPEEVVMKWAASGELPTQKLADKFKTVVLFLDEMNAAAQQVMASAYQLTLNRRIGEYRVPSNCVVIAAGNRETDRGVVYKMPSPLANRFSHLFIRHDYDSWEDWAVERMVNPEVIGFLASNKHKLFDFDPKGSSAAFPTPRSWSFVSDILSFGSSNESALLNLIAGTVGDGVATEFMAYRKYAHQMPNPLDVLTGKVTKMDQENVAAQFSLTISMCYEIKIEMDKNEGQPTDKVYSYVDNFAGFVMDNMKTEVAVMGVRTAIVKFKIPANPKKLKRFTEFSTRFRKYIKAAGTRT